MKGVVFVPYIYTHSKLLVSPVGTAWGTETEPAGQSSQSMLLLTVFFLEMFFHENNRTTS
jgi:hypothetical protein